jgi:iron(III) transport system ATP-binding protein
MTVEDRPLSRSMLGRWGPRGTAAATIAGRLTFDRVSLSYGAIEAVREVSFELEPGEIVCLLGPSGCGKTTLLRLAAGLDRPQSGRIAIDAVDVAGPGGFVPPERRNVGLMFQDFALFPHLSILDNVAFGLRALSRTQAQAEALKALERVGLAHYAHTFPHALSGGEQQRVALARALVPRPQLLLMDEPFSGLDQRLRENVRTETLQLLKETRATSMLVTHDPVEAMGMADRILLMRQGRIVQAGTPRELYDRPVDAEAARFFSDMNELRAAIRAHQAHTPLGSFPAPRSHGTGMVLIRPQAFEVARDGFGVEGYVLDSHFLGDATQSTVLFRGVEEPLIVRCPARNAPAKGTTTHFTLDPVQVFVFPNGEEKPI